MSTTIGECCVRGFKHEGTPTGVFETINGVDTYVAKPTGDYDKTKALVIATDIFGTALNNNKLLADIFAANGIPTYVPNLFGDDHSPEDALSEGSTFDFQGWISKHLPPTGWELYSKVIDGLKSSGISSFAVSGYCYGAAVIYQGLKAGFRPVAITFSHPSFLGYSDFEYIKTLNIPLHLNTAGTDSQYPVETADKVDNLFKGEANYSRSHYPGASHGFTVRVDLNNAELRKDREDATAKTVGFIKKYLYK